VDFSKLGRPSGRLFMCGRKRDRLTPIDDLQSDCAMRYISFMQLFVNGEPKYCAAPSSLSQFIEQLGMKGDRVAVELNREIVPRAQWDSTQLQDGDHLEIVHFVGGGRDF
jgi:sulfur carrier protein